MPSELHEPAARHESGCSVLACPIGQPALPGRSTGRDGRLGSSVFIVGKWQRMGIGSNRRGPLPFGPDPGRRARSPHHQPRPTVGASSSACRTRRASTAPPARQPTPRNGWPGSSSSRRWPPGSASPGCCPPSLEFTVGLDSLGTPIRAHLVPGQIDEVAMVVAGVHGSEQSGVEVADRLLAQLQVDKPFFTVIIVPRLFPDNVAEQGRLGAEDRRRPGEDRAEEVPRTPRQGRRSGPDHRRQERQGSEPPVPGTRRRPGRGQTR